MKKSVFLTTLLAATMLVGCTNGESNAASVGDSSRTPISDNSTTSVPAPVVAHDISIVADATKGLSASANVSSANVGETITVTVVNAHPEKTTVTRVVVNDTIVAQAGSTAGTYTFAMPDVDAEVVVESEDITYDITLLSSAEVYLKGLPEKAQIGDVITFDVLLEPGYHFMDEVKVYSGIVDAEDYVEYDVNLIEGYTYSFAMPALAVNVEVLTNKTEYAITKATSGSSNIQTVRNATTGSSVYSLFGSIGDTIEVTLKDTDSNLAKGIRINGVQDIMLEGASKTVSFIMPARPVVIDTIVAIYERDIAVNNSYHLTASLKKKVDGEFVAITTAVVFDEVYVQISGETEDIVLKSLAVTYDTNKTIATSLDEDSGYYKFTMKAFNDVTVTISEQNLALYKGKAFVGDYLGHNIYGDGFMSGTKPTRSLSINSAGVVTESYNASMVDSTIAELDEVNGKIITSKGDSSYHIRYGNKLAYAAYTPTNEIAQDSMYFVKKTNPDAEYTFNSLVFGPKKHTVVQFYENGTSIGSIYADYTTNEVFMDVTITPLDSEVAFNTPLAEFDISYKGNVIRQVRNTRLDTKNATGFFISNGLEGTYVDEAGTSHNLVINNGKDKATYDGAVYTYVYDYGSDKLTLTSGGTVIEFTIDVANKTFVLLGSELPANEYDGKTYAGAFYDGSDGYYFKIKFTGAANCQITINFGGTGGGSQAYPFMSSHPTQGIDTFVINEADGTISITMYDNSLQKTLVLTPNADKTTLTIDINFSNGYPTAGAVISLLA